MDLEVATIDDIGDELRRRYECFVVAHTGPDKVDKNGSRFNYQYGGTVGGIHNTLGLLLATQHRLLSEFDTPKD